MNSDLLPEERARLNIPRPVESPRPLVPAPLVPVETSVPRAAVGSASLRARLSRIGGSALGSSGRPDAVRHRDPVLTLMQRITFGFNQRKYEHAQELGFQGFLDEQLDPFAIDDSQSESRLASYPVIALSPKEAFEGYESRTQDAYVELKSARVARAVNSERQLYERMCEFWLDHFNIDHNKGLGWALLPEFERTVVRPHALGSFPEMLSACAFSSAMLFYLDNWLNVRSAPQENYARELLELHTLGVHGGYNETDVDEVAKCFTGWTLNPDSSSADWMRGTFHAAQHTPGQKRVLGHVIADVPPVRRPGAPVTGVGATPNDAQAVLDIVAAHPSTARFLAEKLIARFLNPDPPAALVDEVASTYLATRGDIKAMLRAILTRANLSSLALAPKYRRPFHYLVSLARALDGHARRGQDVPLGQLAAMGHSPYDYPAPTGYPDDLASWGGALLPRWTFATAFLKDEYVTAGIQLIDKQALRVELDWFGPADVPGLAQRMNERLFGQMLTAFEVDVLQRYIEDYPSTFDFDALYDSLALAASLPGYQWH